MFGFLESPITSTPNHVIGYNVDIGGSSGTQVVYDGDRQHMRSAFLDFYR